MSRSFHSLITLALIAGCTPDGVDTSNAAAQRASQPLPPPVTLSITPTAVRPGDTVQIDVAGAVPNADLAIVASSVPFGTQACPQLIAPTCLFLFEPISLLATGRSDAQGQWSPTVTVPPGTALGDLWLQAVSLQAGQVDLTNVVVAQVAIVDADGDGLTDAQEIALGTDPTAVDTDGDRVGDGTEVGLGLDPLRTDSDGGGRTDGEELFDDATDPLDPADDLCLRVIEPGRFPLFDVFVRDEVQVQLAPRVDPSTVSASITQGGRVVPLRLSTDGRILAVDPIGDLAPNSSHRLTVSSPTCGSETVQFFTGDPITPLTTADLDGATWSLVDLGDAGPVTGLLQPLLDDADGGFFLRVEPTGQARRLAAHLGRVDAGPGPLQQDTCAPMVPLADLSFRDNQLRTLQAIPFPLSGGGTDAVGLYLDGTVTDDGDLVRSLDLTIAVPESFGISGLDLGGQSLCDLVGTFGETCEPCPHTSGDCAILRATGATAERIVDAQVLSGPAGTDPACAEVTTFCGCSQRGPAGLGFAGMLLLIAGLRRRG